MLISKEQIVEDLKAGLISWSDYWILLYLYNNKIEVQS